MSLTITGELVTSDVVDATAYLVTPDVVDPPPADRWVVDGYPGRMFDRNQAITAMTIAEERARPNPNQALIDSLESELP